MGLFRCLPGPSGAPDGAPRAPAPGQTRGKLVERRALAWSLGGRLGRVFGPFRGSLRSPRKLQTLQHRGKTAANWSNNRRYWACFATSRGPLGPLEGLRAPRHQGKPGANWSNKGPLEPWRPSWACLRAVSGFSWVPEKASDTPAPRQTRGKLVEQRALLGLFRCLLGPSLTIFKPFGGVWGRS